MKIMIENIHEKIPWKYSLNNLITFPLTQKLGASEQNGFRIPILHWKIYWIKKEKNLFYMHSKPSNTQMKYTH